MLARGCLSSRQGAAISPAATAGLARRRCVPAHAAPAPAPPPPVSAASAPSKPLELHMGETTLSIPFTRDSALQLQAAFTALLQSFAAKAKAERPKRWDAMEYKFKGSGTDAAGPELFEVFCNPNAYDTHINAKLLITMRHAGVSFTTETKLHAVKADVDAYLS